MKPIYYIKCYSSVDYRPCSIIGYFTCRASADSIAEEGGNYFDDPRFPLRKVVEGKLFASRFSYDRWLSEEDRRSALRRLSPREKQALGLKEDEG